MEGMKRRSILLGILPLSAVAALAADAVADAKKLSKDGKHEEAIAALEAEMKKAPKNAALKPALSEAHTAYGESLMFNKDLPPFRKYPGALRQFRKAVEYDPKNQKAKEHIATIEGIYKSMGRPVPQ
jgi:tetratricopeptide (TPR) repeat protein